MTKFKILEYPDEYIYIEGNEDWEFTFDFNSSQEDAFEITRYSDTGNGVITLPIDILEEAIKKWKERKKDGPNI